MMTNGTIQDSVKKAAVAVSAGDLEAAKENVELAAKRAGKAVTHVASTVSATAKERPMLAAGVLLGVGALMGAAAYRLLNPPPTAGAVLWSALKRGGTEAGHTLLSGFQRARRAIR